jgi:HAD superfamily hydrolase (TIGR01549 family)
VLKAVIFDLDGTVIESDYDWKLIKKKIGSGDTPILTYIQNLDGELKKETVKTLEGFEKKATEEAILKKGIKKFLTQLTKKGKKLALVTNNSKDNVNYLLKKWDLSFDIIITRDDGVWKPSARPLNLVMEKLSLRRNEVVFIGNSNPDKEAASSAGIPFIHVNYKEGFDSIYSLLDNFDNENGTSPEI